MRRAPAVLTCVFVLGSALLPSAHAGAAAAPTTPRALQAFVALVKRGVSGSFSETYVVSGGPNAGTVELAQDAPRLRTLFLTTRGGAWSFDYTNQMGYVSQWIERGQTAWDCWHPPQVAQWACSGPGQFNYVNGYLMAVSPYIPADVLGALNALQGALTSKVKSIRKIVSGYTLTDSTSPAYGSLRCLKVDASTTCVDRNGVVVSSTGGQIFGNAIKLVRFSRSVSATAFELHGPLPAAGTPFVALHQPYVN